MHIVAGHGNGDKVNRVFDFIQRAIAFERPDLIVLRVDREDFSFITSRKQNTQNSLTYTSFPR
ncbi:hypothetical protein GCM10010869_59350 [Mesorhizobium tianshanense]|nr:hypothetical protein GCM10010869_59350 [Mesorhizobium tianshanense]